MSSLGDRMRAAREKWIPYEGKEFLVRVPTTTQVQLWIEDPWAAIVPRCVIGWRGVTEADLFVDGAADVILDFDADAFEEYVGDRPNLLTAIVKVVQDRVLATLERKEDVKKKSG